MLRLTAGLGYAGMSTELIALEQKLEGVGGFFAVDVGGAPVENFVVHGRFSFVNVAEPTLSLNGQELDVADESSLTMMLLGPAATFYIMPANLYLTGAAGLAVAAISFERSNGTRETGGTDIGWGVNFDVGWEFWIGRSWGIGPALRAFYIAVPDGDGENAPVWKGVGVGVLFSGTFQ